MSKNKNPDLSSHTGNEPLLIKSPEPQNRNPNTIPAQYNDNSFYNNQNGNDSSQTVNGSYQISPNPPNNNSKISKNNNENSQKPKSSNNSSSTDQRQTEQLILNAPEEAHLDDKVGIPLQATLEFWIDIKSIYNIDLFDKGNYHVRISVIESENYDSDSPPICGTTSSPNDPIRRAGGLDEQGSGGWGMK